jgi:hypothetical protein
MRLATSLACLWLAALTGCAATAAPEPVSAPAESEDVPHATMHILGHHCDGGRGIDGLAVHVDKPGVAVIRWSNQNVCGDPA